jgi:hypothetical protein
VPDAVVGPLNKVPTMSEGLGTKNTLEDVARTCVVIAERAGFTVEDQCFDTRTASFNAFLVVE